MATEVETQMGRCTTHGTVEGTRKVPEVTFPWIVNSVRRSFARRRPFLCPTCGEPLERH
jgi:hypothetical protein